MNPIIPGGGAAGAPHGQGASEAGGEWQEVQSRGRRNGANNANNNHPANNNRSRRNPQAGRNNRAGRHHAERHHAGRGGRGRGRDTRAATNRGGHIGDAAPSNRASLSRLVPRPQDVQRQAIQLQRQAAQTLQRGAAQSLQPPRPPQQQPTQQQPTQQQPTQHQQQPPAQLNRTATQPMTAPTASAIPARDFSWLTSAYNNGHQRTASMTPPLLNQAVTAPLGPNMVEVNPGGILSEVTPELLRANCPPEQKVIVGVSVRNEAKGSGMLADLASLGHVKQLLISSSGELATLGNRLEIRPINWAHALQAGDAGPSSRQPAYGISRSSLEIEQVTGELNKCLDALSNKTNAAPFEVGQTDADQSHNILVGDGLVDYCRESMFSDQPLTAQDVHLMFIPGGRYSHPSSDARSNQPGTVRNAATAPRSAINRAANRAAAEKHFAAARHFGESALVEQAHANGAVVLGICGGAWRTAKAISNEGIQIRTLNRDRQGVHRSDMKKVHKSLKHGVKLNDQSQANREMQIVRPQELVGVINKERNLLIAHYLVNSVHWDYVQNVEGAEAQGAWEQVLMTYEGGNAPMAEPEMFVYREAGKSPVVVVQPHIEFQLPRLLPPRQGTSELVRDISGSGEPQPVVYQQNDGEQKHYSVVHPKLANYRIFQYVMSEAAAFKDRSAQNE